jgi:hypothetical protein
LASVPTISASLRASINQNLAEIAELHDEIVGELHKVVPHAEYTQSDFFHSGPLPQKPTHVRWRSLDAVPEHSGDLAWMQHIPGMTAEAHVAAEVVKIYGQRVRQAASNLPLGIQLELF